MSLLSTDTLSFTGPEKIFLPLLEDFLTSASPSETEILILGIGGKPVETGFFTLRTFFFCSLPSTVKLDFSASFDKFNFKIAVVS